MTFVTAVVYVLDPMKGPMEAFEAFTSTLPDNAVFATSPRVVPDRVAEDPDFDVDVFTYEGGRRLEAQAADEEGADEITSLYHEAHRMHRSRENARRALEIVDRVIELRAGLPAGEWRGKFDQLTATEDRAWALFNLA